MDQISHEREVDANYDFFQRNLGRMLREHPGEFALLKSCAVVGYFPAAGAAYDAGINRFPDRLFSIQEVTDEPVHLGFWSVAAT